MSVVRVKAKCLRHFLNLFDICLRRFRRLLQDSGWIDGKKCSTGLNDELYLFFTAWEPRHVHADQPPQLKGMPKAHGFTCTNRGPIDNSKFTLNVPSNAYLTRSHVSKNTYCNEKNVSP